MNTSDINSHVLMEEGFFDEVTQRRVSFSSLANASQLQLAWSTVSAHFTPSTILTCLYTVNIIGLGQPYYIDLQNVICGHSTR